MEICALQHSALHFSALQKPKIGKAEAGSNRRIADLLYRVILNQPPNESLK